MLQDLLHPHVVTESVRGDDPTAALLPEEASQLGWAVDKRTREFTIARTCARRALRRLGLPETPILRGAKREPLWPDGIVGSITHCDGYCAAAVAYRRDLITVGIDAEPHEAMPPGVFHRVSLASERERLAAAPAGVHWDRLLFSAKESVYKAWFPLTRAWLGFEDAEITFDPDAQTFEARLLVPAIAVGGERLARFVGRYAVRDGLVLTAIATLPSPG